MYSEEDSLNETPSGKSSIILEINEKCLINIFVDALIPGTAQKQGRSYGTLHRCGFSDSRISLVTEGAPL